MFTKRTKQRAQLNRVSRAEGHHQEQPFPERGAAPAFTVLCSSLRHTSSSGMLLLIYYECGNWKPVLILKNQNQNKINFDGRNKSQVLNMGYSHCLTASEHRDSWWWGVYVCVRE